MREIDDMAIEAVADKEKLEEFVNNYKPFIIKCASKYSKKYISLGDDEYSIALNAFFDSIISYKKDRGAFIAFSELVIKRRLIDYFRTQGKYNSELTTEFIEDIEDEKANISEIKYEILEITEKLKEYNIDFIQLEGQSPKALKTRETCKDVIRNIIDSSILLEEVKRTKMLPLKILSKNLKVPRKNIERHRKYIIAAIEILSGEYPYLREYFRYVWEDDGRWRE